MFGGQHMSETVKIWLAGMVQNEIEQVTGTISNNNLWMHSSETDEEVEMFAENIANLEEYKSVLETIYKNIEEGTFNV
jgi:hypothetical protein